MQLTLSPPKMITLKTLRLRWTGTRPLILSNPQTVDATNPYAIEARRIGTALKAARKKQDEDKLLELSEEQRRNDFEASSYFGELSEGGVGFYLPDTVILAALKGGAKTLKKGKDIDRAVLLTKTEVLIKTNKHFKSMDEAYADRFYRIEGPCRVPPKTGALIWKARAMMPTGWSVEFDVEYEESLIATKTLVEISAVTGRIVGVGGWRPKFGRFESEVLS